MSNVPMYRNTNNIAFGVSVLIVLESLFTALCRDIESRLSSPYSTGADDDQDDDEERRGEGQDGDEDSGPSPRPALRPGLCLHRARGQGTKEGAASLRPGCSPVRSQFPEERTDDGALRRTPGSRGPQQPVEAAREEAPPPLLQRRVGRGTAPG